MRKEERLALPKHTEVASYIVLNSSSCEMILKALLLCNKNGLFLSNNVIVILFQVTDKLLPLVPSLLSDKGCFYIVTIPENKPDEIQDILCNSGGLKCVTILQRKAGRERLSILRFSHS